MGRKKFKRYLEALKIAAGDETIIYDWKTDYFYLIKQKQGTMKDKYFELAKFMHEEYEKIAESEDWQTQKKCRVPFEKLPRDNMETMLILAKRVYKYYEQKQEKR